MVKLVMKLFCCIMLSLFLASCSSLKSEHYVGKEIPIQEDLQEESIWKFEDTVFYVRALGPKGSAPIIASSLNWNNSKQKYEVTTMQVVMTELSIDNTNAAHFLNLKDEKDDLYKIFRLIPSTNEKDLVILTVDDGTIKTHIKEGKVKAVEKDDDFILKLTKEELDKYVRENLNEIFDYNSAGIIKSIKGFKKE